MQIFLPEAITKHYSIHVTAASWKRIILSPYPTQQYLHGSVIPLLFYAFQSPFDIQRLIRLWKTASIRYAFLFEQAEVTKKADTTAFSILENKKIRHSLKSDSLQQRFLPVFPLPAPQSIHRLPLRYAEECRSCQSER